jgi:beta-glucanase (GH16 family)
MRTYLVILLLLVSGIAYSQGNSCGGPVWSDEFDYTGAPASDKWGYDVGGGGWGNQELQTYTNSRNNSWVENGKLYIKAIKSGTNWTSSRLVTKQKGDWTYGRVEIRAKIPAGRGIWSAIWMLPTDWAFGSWPNSGEIDIMEHVGYDVNRIYGTIHTEAFNHTLGTQKGGNTMVSTAYSEFHDYAIEWDEEKIVIYADQKAYYTFPNQHKTSKEWPFDKRFHLIMNIAIGGTWGGSQGIDPTISEAIMEIEYVRIYDLKPSQPVIEGTTLLMPGQEVTFTTQKAGSSSYKWSVPDDATIISGQGTYQLKVKWGETAGEVGLELQSSCDTLVADNFQVKLLSELGVVTVENFTNEAYNWKVNETQSNTISFEKEGDKNLLVNFNVQVPTNNPNIEYTFNAPQDLRDYSRMVIKLKTEAGKAPSNLRIDLIDEKGLVESDNLFKIDQFPATGEFAEYSHIFGKGTTTQFNIQKVKSIKIYFNYGMNGLIGAGYFTFSPIEMMNKITSSESLKINSLLLWPNPATDYITLDRKYETVMVFDSRGSKVAEGSSEEIHSGKIKIQHLRPGIYLLQATEKGNIFRSKFIKSH